MNLFQELTERNLIKQITNEDKIAEKLNGRSQFFYIGFDPTADSLHVGHLLQLIFAKRLMNHNHIPIILIGGATAKIGDPTGKTDMRPRLSNDQIDNNTICIRKQINNILNHSTIIHVNNESWMKQWSFIDFIQQIGCHFSVNNMMRAECFKSRMEHGLSFLEFSYMLMQGFDFFHLNEVLGCTLQVGGDDQWSNILAGIDLIHKKTGKESFGLTLPLLVNSDGKKMGKTVSGAVWLDSNKTSVFDFFQFWRNTPDSMLMQCFEQLTFLSLDDIRSISFESIDEVNKAKKRLAFEITKIVHGEDQANIALKQAESLFELNDVSTIQSIEINNDIHVLDLIINAGFAKSRTNARNLINNRGISINNEILDNPTITISSSVFGKELIVKKGKKNFVKFTFKDKLYEQT